MNTETIKVIFVPDMWQGYKDNPRAYVLVRFERIMVHGVPVLDSITDTFYLNEEDALDILHLDEDSVKNIETMTQAKYFAWFRANS